MLEEMADTIANSEFVDSHSDPQMMLVGVDLPDYSDRLPDDYSVIHTLGTFDGCDVMFYQPRYFTFDDGELILGDGTIGDGSYSEYEVEFEVRIPLENIVYSRLYNRAGYTGGLIHRRE